MLEEKNPYLDASPIKSQLLGEMVLLKRGARSRKEVAMQLQISEQYLASIEQCKTPDIPTLFRLAYWLNEPVETFF